jgi:hypothetical protein
MNMNTVVTGGGDCGSACNFGIGSLVLSLGITLILVGALFYYVKQRIEVLETSQKEQIHVMQSFIASIGEQFQRMSAYIQEKVGFGPSQPIPNEKRSVAQEASNSRINISDSERSESDSSESESESDSNTASDSEYESSSDNSRSSNTTRDSARDQYEKSPQIKIHDASDTINSVNSMDNVKIIELTSAQIEPEPEPEQDSESESSDSEASDSESSESEPDSEADHESEMTSRNDDTNTNIPVHVTKIDGTASNSDSDKFQSQSQNQKKTLIIDLDGDLDGESGASIEVEHQQSQYDTLTIKQLRQLLKKKNQSMLMNDIAKMKREQIVQILQG